MKQVFFAVTAEGLISLTLGPSHKQPHVSVKWFPCINYKETILRRNVFGTERCRIKWLDMGV